MITFEEIEQIARRDNEAFPDTVNVDMFGVDDEAVTKFAVSAAEAYMPAILAGAPVELAIMAAVKGGVRMGMLIAREQTEANVPDAAPEEWSK